MWYVYDIPSPSRPAMLHTGKPHVWYRTWVVMGLHSGQFSRTSKSSSNALVQFTTEFSIMPPTRIIHIHSAHSTWNLQSNKMAGSKLQRTERLNSQPRCAFAQLLLTELWEVFLQHAQSMILHLLLLLSQHVKFWFCQRLDGLAWRFWLYRIGTIRHIYVYIVYIYIIKDIYTYIYIYHSS